MARVRLPPAWESAPDILRTNYPQQHRQARPHSRSSPLPGNQPPPTRRSISRRGTYPEPRVHRAFDGDRAVRELSRTPDVDGIPDPPYPVTPPPDQPRSTLPQIRLPRQELSQLGYRAPTPLPPTIVPVQAPKPDDKPPRLLQIQRRCARQLDASLPTLSIASLASGSILLVSAILFVRSVMMGTPHAIAGRSALIVFFALSVAAFIVSFGLILGVLCRRARATKSSAVRAQVRQEIELTETRPRANDDRLPMYDISRRNAICEFREGSSAVRDDRGRPSTRLVPRDEGRIINRPNAPPVRVASRHLSGIPFSRPDSPYPRQALSPLIPSTPPPPIPERNPARLFASTAVSTDALSTLVHPSPASGVSPKTTVTRAAPQAIDNVTVSGRSTQMFNQHLLTAGTRELQAYLDAPSNSSLNTIAAYQHSESDSSSTQAIMSNDRSVYSNELDEPDAEEEPCVGEAYLLSLRKVGKARECYIPASESEGSASKPRKADKQRRSGLKVFTDIPRPQEKKPERQHRGMLDPLPSAPLFPSVQKSTENRLSAIKRSCSLSPKKLSGLGAKPNLVGLGIFVGKEQDKENMDPGHAGVETWSALGRV